MLDTWKKVCCITSRIPGILTLVFLEMFKSSYYQDLSLTEWLSHTPPELVMAHLNIDKAAFDALPKTEGVVLPVA